MINFSAGPTGLSFDVLKEAYEQFLDYNGEGYNIMEISHRSKSYEEVHCKAISDMKKLYGLGDEYEILLLQGGAHLQFSMVPLNLYKGGFCEYANTGVWTTKAIKEAQILGFNHKVVASSEDKKFSYIPNINFSDNADFCYICSNNTIYGTQYKTLPKTLSPLVIDASSDFFSRPLDFSNIGVIYGGAQKNAGPSGVCVVIIKKELLQRLSCDSVPTYLRYKTHADANSLYNTPPTFAIYLLGLNMKNLLLNGGLESVDMKNREKAKLIYDMIDCSGGFYKGHAESKHRSLMNVSFNIVDTNLEAKFISSALELGMLGLKGHRHLGGIRASIYNAVSYDDVRVLVDFMGDFMKKYG